LFNRSAFCGDSELLALKREKDNDERQLRKLSRKLHQHANARREALARATSNAAPEQLEADQQTIAETFQNVQVELDAFLLLMEKLELVRLAERRQAEEYEILRERICKLCCCTWAVRAVVAQSEWPCIVKAHDETRLEIERLKAELREAEAQRERKKEYDVIAERVNQLPPRSELNAYTLHSLES
jgi:THO complex subunit 7